MEEPGQKLIDRNYVTEAEAEALAEDYLVAWYFEKVIKILGRDYIGCAAWVCLYCLKPKLRERGIKYRYPKISVLEDHNQKIKDAELLRWPIK